MDTISESPEMLRLKKKLGVELLWVYILSILKKGDVHAYVLRDIIEKKYGFLPGQVSSYVVLYKLETRGFVTSKEEDTKVIYTITKSGRELLDAAKKELKTLLKAIE